MKKTKTPDIFCKILIAVLVSNSIILSASDGKICETMMMLGVAVVFAFIEKKGE